MKALKPQMKISFQNHKKIKFWLNNAVSVNLTELLKFKIYWCLKWTEMIYSEIEKDMSFGVSIRLIWKCS